MILDRLKSVDWTRWRPRLAYGAFALVAFALSLRWTFPVEAMKERLIMEAGQRGWQLDAERVSPGGFLGIRARGLKLESATGLAIPVEDLTASLRLLPLLVGRPSIAFDAALYGGRVEGTADVSGDPRRVVVEVSGVDLARVSPLRDLAGLDLVGKVNAKADLKLPDAASKPPNGRVDLVVKEAGIAGGQLPLPAMSSSLTLPRMGLGQIDAGLKIADGRATFDKLEATGGDAEIRTENVYFLVQPRMEFAPIFGKAKLKVQEAFWSKSGAQGFKGLTEAALASAKGPDGTWSFAIIGSVGHPRMQPLNQGQ